MRLSEFLPFSPQVFAMAPNTTGDALLPVSTAIEKATGYRPHPTTCTRWTRKGVGGVKLRTVMVGGRPKTTESWVAEFIRERTAQTDAAQ